MEVINSFFLSWEQICIDKMLIYTKYRYQQMKKIV